MAKHTAALVIHEGEQVVAEAVRRVVAEAGVDIDWRTPDAPLYTNGGWSDDQWTAVTDAIHAAGHGLIGALGAAGQTERSPHVELRERVGSWAGIRPVKAIKGLPCRVPDIDVIVIRETTEDVYAGHEHEVMPGGVATLKVVSEVACRRIAHFAFQYARDNGRKKVSVIHKANIMKKTDGMFMRIGLEVGKAYPDIACDDLIVDNASMQMVLRPERYDVLLCGNLYGDILSALAAGLAGGVNAKAGVAIGDNATVFESLTHHEVDDEGRFYLNPLPLLLPTIYLLRHVGEGVAAERVMAAVEGVLQTKTALTPDLGGAASTTEMGDAIAKQLSA